MYFNIEDYIELDHDTKFVVDQWILDNDLQDDGIVLIQQADPDKIVLSGVNMNEKSSDYGDTEVKRIMDDSFPWETVKSAMLSEDSPNKD